MSDKKLFFQLAFAGLLLTGAAIWFVVSFIAEYKCLQDQGWFARSGAILVLTAIWSGLLTRPMAQDAEVPDFVNTYNHASGTEPLANDHWTVKYNVSQKLLYLELLLGSIGTVIWAYGDLWVPRCCT